MVSHIFRRAKSRVELEWKSQFEVRSIVYNLRYLDLSHRLVIHYTIKVVIVYHSIAETSELMLASTKITISSVSNLHIFGQWTLDIVIFFYKMFTWLGNQTMQKHISFGKTCSTHIPFGDICRKTFYHFVPIKLHYVEITHNENILCVIGLRVMEILGNGKWIMHP